MKLRQNELTKESSPYLLQHAKNPVEWQAWSDEVFEMAKRENKLVLVSVGYSACHWCHVMEHECFEDEEVAEIMNAHFINVKVDREERPDVDHVYMTAVQLMTDRGGWPLNCFTLPNGQPVYGGTYFPKDQWIHILKSLVYTYEKDPEKVIGYAKNLTEGIQQNELIDQPATIEDFPFSKMEEMIQRWSKKFDSSEGGPTHAPKFPLPNNYLFLLRYGQLKKQETVNNHVMLTLHKMGFGGIYDQLKGGFARYSVDMLWKVPHFEKMLYDNGQLLQLYADVYAVTQDPHFYRLMDQTVNWLETEMLSPEGGLYSAIDADSEGEEGKFYCWTKKELTQLLDADEQWFLDYYNINQKGYWEEEKYILLRSQSDASFVKKMNFSQEEFAEKLDKVHSKLLAVREKRIRPGTDNKQLCSWNALALSGLIRVSEVCDHLGAQVLTQKVLRFLNQLKRADGGLYRNFNQGQANIDAFLEDYAALIQAYLDDYQSHLNEDSLAEALRLTEYVNEHFSHPTSGMYYFTEKSSTLISRKMELNDNVLPSSNSIMAKNLYRLGMISSNTAYTTRSKQMLSNISDGMEMYGSGYSNWADLYLNFSSPVHEICIIGPKAKEWVKILQSHYLPHVVLFGSTSEDATLFPFKGQIGKTLIYHCMNETCDAPIESLEDLIRKLLG